MDVKNLGTAIAASGKVFTISTEANTADDTILFKKNESHH